MKLEIWRGGRGRVRGTVGVGQNGTLCACFYHPKATFGEGKHQWMLPSSFPTNLPVLIDISLLVSDRERETDR